MSPYFAPGPLTCIKLYRHIHYMKNQLIFLFHEDRNDVCMGGVPSEAQVSNQASEQLFSVTQFCVTKVAVSRLLVNDVIHWNPRQNPL